MIKEEINEQKPIKSPFYYGWIVLVVAALGLFFSGPGQTYSISIFINHYIDKFGWSRSLISSFYSIATLISGLILTFVGRYIDKLGHRKMTTIISILFGFACIWMSLIFNPLMIFIGFFLLRLLGQGSMSLLPQTLVPHWFKQKRGLALSLLGIGGVISSSLLPPLNNWLINTYSLTFTWRLWSFLLIFFMAPVGWIFIRNKPENIGLNPDGIDQEDNTIAPKIHISEDPWTLNQSMKTRSFWFMNYCGVVSALVTTGLTFHMVSIVNNIGYSPSFAALILSITAMIKFPFTFVAGWLLDRFKVNIIKGINFLILSGAIFLLLRADSKITLIIYALVHGTFMAFDAVSTGVVWPNYFGRENLGSIRGFAMTTMVIGSALGPLPFGVAYDYFGGYHEIMIGILILPTLAVFASLFSPPPNYKFKNK
ncbi:MAG TPA: MFS transporter [Halanaerobiales bacterium]|nr:MFS transporter [Halanaerobiales bacterium]